MQALLPPSLKALPAARGGGSKPAKAQVREPGRMSADELRDVLKMLRMQRPRGTLDALDALAKGRRDGSAASKASGEGATRHKTKSSSVLGDKEEAASRCADVLLSATMPPSAGAQMRHRKVFASSTTSKRWAPERSRPLSSPLGASASAPTLRLPSLGSSPSQRSMTGVSRGGK